MDESSQHDDEPPPPSLTLDVVYAVGADGLPTEATFREWAQTALATVWVRQADDPAELELSLRVVDDDESRRLNREWRERDRPTNVLSFPGESLPGLPWRHLGDLVICAEVVFREAGEQGKSTTAHWAHMVVHGLLHLLGHDHQEDEEAERMEALERQILARLGYSDPYAVSDADTPDNEPPSSKSRAERS